MEFSSFTVEKKILHPPLVGILPHLLLFLVNYFNLYISPISPELVTSNSVSPIFYLTSIPPTTSTNPIMSPF